MTTPDPLGAQLADFRRTTEVGLTRVQGGIDLLVQRAEQSDRRLARIDTEIQTLDSRVDQVERTAVTREDLDKKSTRTTATIGVIVGVVSIVASAGTSVLIAVIK